MTEHIITSCPIPLDEICPDKMRPCKTLARQLFTDRVSIDLDDCGLDAAMRTVSRMLSSDLAGRTKYIDVVESSSGTGYHVIAWLTEKMHWTEHMQYRIKFGDCQDRLRHSIRNISAGLDNFDILFTDKFYKTEHRRIRPVCRIYGKDMVVKLDN